MGQTNTNTAGNGIKDAVVSSTVRREGHKIVTEVTVDLGTSKADIKQSNDDGDVIGVDGVAGAYITRLTPAVNGYITYVEMACLEVPTAASNPCTHIDLHLDSNATRAYDNDGSGYTVLITADDAWTLGEVDHYAVAHGTDLDIGADNGYVYLVNGHAPGGASVFTGGKFVITFEGYAAPADK